MAVNPRAIKRQIRSVENLKKITKAMEMVSASKLRRAQTGLTAIRPYSDKLRELVQSLTKRAGGKLDAPMLKPRDEVRKKAYVVISGDKGLCGSYNSAIQRLASKTLAAETAPLSLYTIGRKAGDHFRKEGRETAGHWQGLPPSISIKEVREITDQVIGAYRRHEVDEVHIVYTKFINAARYKQQTFQFLPFDASSLVGDATGGAGDADDQAAGGGEMIFEPGPDVILSQLIPRYIEVLFFRILLESLASEHAARMTSMRNATDNAVEMVGELTLTYNKVRQGAITAELLDIIGGAEALRG